MDFFLRSHGLAFPGVLRGPPIGPHHQASRLKETRLQWIILNIESSQNIHKCWPPTKRTCSPYMFIRVNHDRNLGASTKNTVCPVHASRSLRCGSSARFQSSTIENLSPSWKRPIVSLTHFTYFASFGPPATFNGVNKHSRGLQ